eukprot:1191558-Prorocentrum_minimum.AAC.1
MQASVARRPVHEAVPVVLRPALLPATTSNQTQEAQVYSHDGPIRQTVHEAVPVVLRPALFPATTSNQTQEAQVYSHDEPISLQCERPQRRSEFVHLSPAISY